jgi:hypothetical protein
MLRRGDWCVPEIPVSGSARAGNDMLKMLLAFLLVFAVPLSLCSSAFSIFTDVTADAGVVALGTMSEGAGWGDFNGDGLLDLFVAHYDAQNALYVNNGDSTFTDTAN